jgi:hypothetical protein
MTRSGSSPQRNNLRRARELTLHTHTFHAFQKALAEARPPSGSGSGQTLRPSHSADPDKTFLKVCPNQ